MDHAGINHVASDSCTVGGAAAREAAGNPPMTTEEETEGRAQRQDLNRGRSCSVCIFSAVISYIVVSHKRYYY